MNGRFRIAQLLDSLRRACSADGLSERPIAAIVMGVTGSGKTTVGSRLAEKLHCGFYDGDDYHPAANIAKMRRGEPLTDQDREPWLDRLRQLIGDKLAAGESAVIACSALRAAYRARLIPADPSLSGWVRFVYLSISPEVARERLAARAGHFMPAALVASQFETLEEPNGALRIDASLPVEQAVERALALLSETGLSLRVE
jgi:gluconokinase